MQEDPGSIPKYATALTFYFLFLLFLHSLTNAALPFLKRKGSTKSWAYYGRRCVYTAKDIGYFSLSNREVVYINFKLILQLKLLIIKYRVGSIYK